MSDAGDLVSFVSPCGSANSDDARLSVSSVSRSKEAKTRIGTLALPRDPLCRSGLHEARYEVENVGSPKALDFTTIEAAHAFVDSEELKSAMQNAGVVGAPTIWFINKV